MHNAVDNSCRNLNEFMVKLLEEEFDYIGQNP